MTANVTLNGFNAIQPKETERFHEVTNSKPLVFNTAGVAFNLGGDWWLLWCFGK